MPLICGSSLTVKRTVAVPSGPGCSGSDSITHMGTSAGPVTAIRTVTGAEPAGAATSSSTAIASPPRKWPLSAPPAGSNSRTAATRGRSALRPAPPDWSAPVPSRLRSRSAASTGSPSCSTRPWSRTTPRLQIRGIRSRAWVTNRIGAAALLELADLVQALALERLVADGQDLVDQQDVGADVDGHGEPEAHVLAGAVVLDLVVDERLELGEGDDLVEVALGLAAAQAEDGRVQVDVLAAGQLAVEAGPQLQQRRDPAPDGHRAGGRGEDARRGPSAASTCPSRWGRSARRSGRRRSRGRPRAAPRTPPSWTGGAAAAAP